jgi:protease I
VEDEVRAALAAAADFIRGPISMVRDSPDHLDAGFTVRDGNYLSARWPGDAHRFANEFASMLAAQSELEPAIKTP